MTEQDMSAPESLADFGDHLEDWIAGASLTRRSVIVYGNGAVVQRLDDLRETLMNRGVDVNESGELSLGDVAEDAELLAEYDEAWREREKSKSEWIIEDISPVVEQVREEVGPAPIAPDEPVRPVLHRGASEAQKRTHNIAMQKYEGEKASHAEALAEYEREAIKWSETYGLTTIARATVEIRFPDGEVTQGVTVEQLRRIRDAVGEAQMLRLANAVRDTMLTEPVITAPFSQTTSQDDEDLSTG